MQSRLTDMRFIKCSFRIIFIFFLLTSHSLICQNSKKIKIDGVSAVVGDYIILNSDIDKTFVEMES